MTNDELFSKVAKIAKWEFYKRDSNGYLTDYNRPPNFLNSYDAIMPVIQRWCGLNEERHDLIHKHIGYVFAWMREPRELCRALVAAVAEEEKEESDERTGNSDVYGKG